MPKPEALFWEEFYELTHPIEKHDNEQIVEISLFCFLEKAWPTLNPGIELKLHWSHELICEWLEAVWKREKRRVVFNVAPRSLKSTIASVVFPCWTWIQNPAYRWLCLSYAGSLANNHSDTRRGLIQSNFFQGCRKLTLSGSKNRISEFQNLEFRGEMLARGLEGSVTGSGGDGMICDDPNDPEKTESDAVRESNLKRFRGYSASRLNDPIKSPIVVIQQRTHQGDITGYCQSLPEYEFLKLPTISGKDEILIFPLSGKQVQRQAGTLLNPDRGDWDTVNEQRRELGEYGFAARHQQEPSPLGGGMFKIQYWELYKKAPQNFLRVAISMDPSFKGGVKNDPTAIQVWGQTEKKDGYHHYYLLDQFCGPADIVEAQNQLKRLAKLYPAAFKKLIEDSANGPAIVTQLKHEVSGIESIRVGSDKISRATPLIAVQQRGCLHLPLVSWATEEISIGAWLLKYPPTAETEYEGLPLPDWGKAFVKEFAKFPLGDHDDQVDAASLAINWLEAVGSTQQHGTAQMNWST